MKRNLRPRPARRPRKLRSFVDGQEVTPRTNSLTHRPAPPPLSLDAQRYRAFRAGVSKEELAARENVKLSTISASIERMEIEKETFSQEAVDLVTRKSVIEASAARHNALLDALMATQQKLIHIETENGDAVKWVDQPDYAVRLRAMTQLNAMIESIKQATPLVSVNQQTNLQQNFNQTPGGLSIESIIREVRIERGMAVGDESEEKDVYAEPLPDEIDFELQAELKEAEEAGIIDAEEEEEDGEAKVSEEVKEEISEETGKDGDPTSS